MKEARRRNIIALAGFIAFYACLASAFIVLLKLKLIRLPFHRVSGIIESYSALISYMPVFVIALVSMLWLKFLEVRVFNFLKWKRFSLYFIFGLVLSAGYAFYILVFNKHEYHPVYFIIPVIILSLLNSFSEEMIYRFVFLRLLENSGIGFHTSNIIQSLFYSFLHIFIGGYRLAILGFIYGLLMGHITKKSESLLPAMICHFVIDIGVIGLPMMIARF